MEFDEAADKMPDLLKARKSREPVRFRGSWQKKKAEVPRNGVYVFYENGKPLYVGRSNSLAVRIEGHGAANGTQYGATFAFKLLKEKVGGKNSQGMTSKEMQVAFKDEYERQRARVRKMDVRVVQVTDQVEQTIFEIYAILALTTTPKYNEFRTI